MNWWKKFPWRRLLAALVIAVMLLAVAAPAEGEKRFVSVDGNNSDAVILDSPDWMGGIVSTLDVNDEVELTGKEDGDYVEVTRKVGRKQVKGWVKATILSKTELRAESRISEGEGGKATAQAAKGFNEEIENEMREGSDDMNEWLMKVDKFEATRNKELGGDPENPDTKQVRTHYTRFGKDGRLIN